MKTLLTVALLTLATLAHAQPAYTNYMFTLIKIDIKHVDKVIEKLDERTTFSDSTTVEFKARPVVTQRFGESNQYAMLCYWIDVPGMVNISKKGMKVDKVKDDLKKNISEESKDKVVVIAGGISPKYDLEDWLNGIYYTTIRHEWVEGYEPVPAETP